MNTEDRYSYKQKYPNTYIIVHTEQGVSTYIATCDTAEKANFLCQAANQFDMEIKEKEPLK